MFQGAGTAIGELPPYFMARAARLSGVDPEDDDFEELEELIHEKKDHPEELVSIGRRQKEAWGGWDGSSVLSLCRMQHPKTSMWGHRQNVPKRPVVISKLRYFHTQKFLYNIMRIS